MLFWNSVPSSASRWLRPRKADLAAQRRQANLAVRPRVAPFLVGHDLLVERELAEPGAEHRDHQLVVAGQGAVDRRRTGLVLERGLAPLDLGHIGVALGVQRGGVGRGGEDRAHGVNGLGVGRAGEGARRQQGGGKGLAHVWRFFPSDLMAA